MTRQPDLAIVLVAAGGSARMGFPKLWTDIRGQPLLAYALAAAVAAQPAELILVVPPDRVPAATDLLSSVAAAALWPSGMAVSADSAAGSRSDVADSCRRAAFPARVARVVPGGGRRRDSVAAGLAASSATWLAIHDAARALAPPELFARGLAAAQTTGAAIPGVPLKDTIKRIAHNRVLGTPPRSEHVAVQTPQIFRRDVLERALALTDDDATDEAALAERLGIAVTVFDGDERAFKVTTPLDFELAKTLLTAALRPTPSAETAAERAASITGPTR